MTVRDRRTAPGCAVGRRTRSAKGRRRPSPLAPPAQPPGSSLALTVRRTTVQLGAVRLSREVRL